MQITELTPAFFPAVVSLANTIHGDNYLSHTNLAAMQLQGIARGINASFVAVDEQQQLVGYRLSFAAGQWQSDNWCSEALWPVARADMAYFKSVGVSAGQRGKGIASSLLRASVTALKQQGAKAGLAHIWRESPGNAAQRYFSRAGAVLVKVHPQRWRHLSETVGYFCPVCGALCNCSAAEMVLTFNAR
ncbi:GNAT superfamily N-acetyltransferase [Rheinheimera pacifica]|uniref:GNAT family N-acetyltransferase n=1 Tax=Rheinheimera pacifica TaxID=173990 RepID=UPI002168DA0E|nr:GNAT family N-acetyltransferase [Rheinheimera pacifica]MCS4309043.1 GNAT superfamily N-acetyltransferase [Rheinheimera pacifica]